MKKRKYHTAEEKQFILAQGDANGVAQTCREHGIATSLYYNWRKILKEHGPEGLAGKRSSPSPEASELARMKSENALLKRLLAEKEMELSLAKDLIKKSPGPSRNDTANHQVRRPGLGHHQGIVRGGTAQE